MAIYRCEVKLISRGQGHSAIAAAAYRTGTKLQDERAGKIHDYSNRQKSVVQSVILRPENAPAFSQDTASLWNEVERSEKRKDAQLAREFILSLPKELSTKEQFQLAVEWTQRELVSKGMVAELSLHDNGKGNPHVHILCTLRTIEGEKLSAKKPREWNDKTVLLDQRESWGKAVNAALEKAGRPERVDHRSLKDRGIDQIPQPKIGKEAMGMKQRGVVDDPRRFQLVRFVKSLNFARPWLKAIERAGEVFQHGLGATWWERSLNAVTEGAKEFARETVKDAWAKMLQSRSPMPPDFPPPLRGRDMDMER
jgi:ATP-dependent exoDNAse (exonuclease V) alpha subunit